MGTLKDIQNDVRVIQFHSDIQSAGIYVQEFLKGLSGLEPTARQHNAVFLQVLKPDFLLLGQRVVLTHYRLQLAAEQDIRLDIIVVLGRFICKDKVNFPFAEHGVEFHRCLVIYLQFHAGVKLCETVERFREELAESLRQSYAERSGKQFSQIDQV